MLILFHHRLLLLLKQLLSKPVKINPSLYCRPVQPLPIRMPPPSSTLTAPVALNLIIVLDCSKRTLHAPRPFRFCLPSLRATFCLPPPSCSRSAACHHPAHLSLIPIPSAMSRDLACALHPDTLSLICWGDASIAAIIPALVVCVLYGEHGCKAASLNGGGAGYQLAPRLYDSTHSDGRFVDIMPAPLKGVGGQMCDSTTDIARISVLSVSFSPSTTLCNQSSCSCTM